MTLHRKSPITLAGCAAGTAAAFVLVIASACGVIRTVSRDGYRATLTFSPGDSYRIAVRGEWRRVDGDVEGAPLVKIMRPDLKKTWQFRPRTQRIFEEGWSPTDEIVPGFPLDPHFDSQAYAARFHAVLTKIADAAFGGHPCDRYQLDMTSGDRVVISVARDLERLPIRVEHSKKRGEEDFVPFLEVRLDDVRTGAEESLFQKPKGMKPVASYDELRMATAKAP
jgi:hypothetical protein